MFMSIYAMPSYNLVSSTVLLTECFKACLTLFNITVPVRLFAPIFLGFCPGALLPSRSSCWTLLRNWPLSFFLCRFLKKFTQYSISFRRLCLPWLIWYYLLRSSKLKMPSFTTLNSSSIPCNCFCCSCLRYPLFPLSSFVTPLVEKSFLMSTFGIWCSQSYISDLMAQWAAPCTPSLIEDIMCWCGVASVSYWSTLWSRPTQLLPESFLPPCPSYCMVFECRITVWLASSQWAAPLLRPSLLW